MDFRYIPEPCLSELNNYVQQRKAHIHCYVTLADVKSELLRNVTEQIQPVDSYPKGRQFLQDEEYLSVLKDMFNLSNVLDDLEQTGAFPHHTRGQYYNVYTRLYRMLLSKAKQSAGTPTA